MAKPMTDDEARIRVREVMDEIGTAMFVTVDEQGRLRSRPMQQKGIGEDGRTVWFFTASGSPKAEEIGHDGRVLLAYGGSGRSHYCSVYGQARIERDVARQKALWSEADRVWFPQGPESPDLVLIAVEIDGAEYWDPASSVALFAYGYPRALLTGRPAEGGEARKVAFRH
ncbi:pyridoxamine 5'-phosphate oxidase family protein [Roseomonas hellenica]|uniref:Pyridoxamine 5'-phosphate oxidase family protein n=1 Tax=Plastoroseomonas hellenica TaxID=2687306 RepID=A0ABS5ES67_9PROT|nr:pyridoxamine 5'-phosphate oxidase family protein [Plastoroseomonas hellenica]MBR0663134.1 pyridoxamine 5'-phosphate oxidase family protein [Plastoroseomonas hellenica]